MRKFLIFILVAAALWSGYWVVGSRAVTTSAQHWLESGKAAGRVASYGALRMRGFPNRFDLTLNDLQLTDPATGIIWSAPFLQILRLSYDSDHVILIFPETQTITLAQQDITVASERMQASVVFEPGSDPALDRANFVGDRLAMTSDAGWSARTDSLLLAVRQTPEMQQTWDFGAETRALWFSGSAGTRDIVANIDHMRLDAALSFDRSWDRSLTEPRPALANIDLRALQISIGAAEISASGTLAVDRSGILEGSIAISTPGRQDVLTKLREFGWAPDWLVTELENSGSADRPISLRFSGGEMFFGPTALGGAPRLAGHQRQ